MQGIQTNFTFADHHTNQTLFSWINKRNFSKVCFLSDWPYDDDDDISSFQFSEETRKRQGDKKWNANEL